MIMLVCIYLPWSIWKISLIQNPLRREIKSIVSTSPNHTPVLIHLQRNHVEMSRSFHDGVLERIAMNYSLAFSWNHLQRIPTSTQQHWNSVFSSRFGRCLLFGWTNHGLTLRLQYSVIHVTAEDSSFANNKPSDGVFNGILRDLVRKLPIDLGWYTSQPAENMRLSCFDMGSDTFIFRDT